MATFYFNKFSSESYESQWQRYIQNQSFAEDVTQSLGQQTKDFSTIISAHSRSMQETINSASAEQKLAIEESTKAICGTFESGVNLLSNNLNEISFGIENIRSEINDLASMLDWNFSLLIEQQRISNILLGNIAILLRIPDIQKERQYYLEQGLKFFRNALIDDDFFEDALSNFLKAEAIEPTDYFIMHRIALVYMYSLKHLDLTKAEEYFKKAAKYAVVETMNGASISYNYLNNDIDENSLNKYPTIGSIKDQAAESYLYAARCCYIQGKFIDAAEFAAYSYNLVPLLTEAGFTQAKALVANGDETQATIVLQQVIETDRYFSIKTISDPDLCQNGTIRLFLNSLRDNAVQKLNSSIEALKNILNSQSEYTYFLNDLENHCIQNTYLDALRGLDILNTEYNWTIKNFLYKNFSYPPKSFDNSYSKFKFNKKNELIRLNEEKDIHELTIIDCNTEKVIKSVQLKNIIEWRINVMGDLVCITKKDDDSNEIDAYNITREIHTPILHSYIQRIKPNWEMIKRTEISLSYDGEYISILGSENENSGQIIIWKFNSGKVVCKYPKSKFTAQPENRDKDNYDILYLASKTFFEEKLNRNSYYHLENIPQPDYVSIYKYFQDKQGHYTSTEISPNCLYVIKEVKDRWGNSVSNKSLLYRNNVIAPNVNIRGTFEAFIKAENENFFNIKKNEEYEKEMSKVKEKYIQEIIAKAQIEEKKQNSKWVGKNFSEAIRFYQIAAGWGNDFAEKKVAELSAR